MADTGQSPNPVADRDLAPVAALVGDSTRVAILAALTEGHALPAGELARRAGVHPATATAHLHQLIAGGLIRVHVQGRHRYHELAGPQVAAVVEALAQLAPPAPVRSLRAHRAASGLAEARRCYDHLAGRRGVELRDHLLTAGAVYMVDDRDHELTTRGEHLLTTLDIDPRSLRATRRVVARCCIDWTSRRPHLAGILPAAITTAFLTRGWLSHGPGRSLRVADDYDRELKTWLAG